MSLGLNELSYCLFTTTNLDSMGIPIPALLVKTCKFFSKTSLFYAPLTQFVCQATCVQSHQRQPNHTRDSQVVQYLFEVQVSATDSPAVPTVTNSVTMHNLRSNLKKKIDIHVSVVYVHDVLSIFDEVFGMTCVCDLCLWKLAYFWEYQSRGKPPDHHCITKALYHLDSFMVSFAQHLKLALG